MKTARFLWRIGAKVKLNVYEGDRPVCQCHTEADAKAIVDAVNASLLDDPEVYKQ